jgi:hypothetical protein
VVASYPVVQNRESLRHFGVGCSDCGTLDFTGFRYQCEQCPNFNFCESCEAKGGHWKMQAQILKSTLYSAFMK